VKAYFNFSRKEKIGVVVLSSLILVLTVVLNVGYNTYVPDPFDVDLNSLDFLVLNNSNSSPDSIVDKEIQKDNKITITNFDPNKINLEKWMSFGFSEKQAASILKYKNSFGPFKNKKDLKKLYVISDEKFAEIEPFIQIEKTPINTDQINYKEIPESEPVDFELNSASHEDLVSLSGIGDYYAKKIIDYRKKIGGFVDFEQIEKMSIADDAKAILREMTHIDSENLQKTNINTASKTELKNIPYSNWLTIAAILKQRDKQIITNLDFLTENEIANKDKIKFAMYIEF